MHVIILKYVQVLCITIFFSNNINCDKLLLHNEQEDQELYRIGACTAACMAGAEGSPASPATPAEAKSIERCYSLCSEDRRPESAWRPLVQRRQPSLRINLICRDSTNLIVEVRPSEQALDEDVIDLSADAANGERNHAPRVDAAANDTTRAEDPLGKANQLDVERDTGTTRVKVPDEEISKSKVTSGASRRKKRAIGTGGGHASPGTSQELVLSERQKPAAAGNHLLTATKAGRRTSQPSTATVHASPGRRSRQPIYLVKVQESEKELGDRIVYMCPYTKLQRIAADKRHTIVKVDVARQFGLRVLDRDVGQYSYPNDSNFCQLSNLRLGEFGVYDLRLLANANGRECALETAREPVNVYLPFLTLALICAALLGVVRFARHGLKRTRPAGAAAAAAAAAGTTTEEEDIAEGSDKPPAAAAATAQAAKKRLQSLDTFRGVAIMLMIFVNSGGGHYWWIEHATWNGLHVADLVFPWFLFIMGVCVPISLRGQLSRNVPRRTIASNIAIRSLKLFVIGLCLNSMNGPSLANLRIFGVLQRFGVAYFVVSMLHLFCYEETVVQSQNRLLRANEDILRLRKQWLVVGLLTVVYLGVILFVAEPGCPSGYFGPGGKHLMNAHPNCTGGITGYIDRMLLGIAHLYQRPTARYVYDAMPFDPEGPFGCLPTVLQVFLGLQCGSTILNYAGHRQRMVRFGVWSVLLGLLAGFLCGFSKNDGWIPVNKNLWSLSYVLATASLGYLLLLLCYYAIDVKRSWSGKPFVYAGMNAIVLYVGHTVFHKMLPWHWRIGTMNTHFMLTAEALWNTVLWNLIALYLFKRRIFYNL